ncbi:MAG: DUF342 domain-containing protein [Lachnospiraceae bacterium]
MDAFFRIVNKDSGTYIDFIPEKTNGKKINMEELISYLEVNNIEFNLTTIKNIVHSLSSEQTVKVNENKGIPIPEKVEYFLSEDNMELQARIIPGSNDGEVISKTQMLNDLKCMGINFGIVESNIDIFLSDKKYFTYYLIAKGENAVPGKDAYVEYLFDIDPKAHPKRKEDGSVDYFNLDIFSKCSKGGILAKLHPAVAGICGKNLKGQSIKPQVVKKKVLKVGKNVELSPDKKEAYSMIDGHVELSGETIVVNDVMILEEVDTSTGNISYDGDVKITGNVRANFEIIATGNVEVLGSVESATIEAGKNIMIARGMNGMGKGKLIAGESIMVSFIENTSVEAKGNIKAGAILYSNVLAGTHISVVDNKGAITGGYLCATNYIEANILGSKLGADTILEVGVNPNMKQKYKDLQKDISEARKTILAASPVIDSIKNKIATGVKMPKAQVKQVQELSNIVTLKQKELIGKEQEITTLHRIIQLSNNSYVIGRKEIFQGTKIVISDVSQIVKETVKECKFVKQDGVIKYQSF